MGVSLCVRQADGRGGGVGARGAGGWVRALRGGVCPQGAGRWVQAGGRSTSCVLRVPLPTNVPWAAVCWAPGCDCIKRQITLPPGCRDWVERRTDGQVKPGSVAVGDPRR